MYEKAEHEVRPRVLACTRVSLPWRVQQQATGALPVCTATNGTSRLRMYAVSTVGSGRTRFETRPVLFDGLRHSSRFSDSHFPEDRNDSFAGEGGGVPRSQSRDLGDSFSHAGFYIFLTDENNACVSNAKG